jgi:phosphopantothenoylcysteine decarboxylase/phosphopantothenate--cysteine ligase
LQDVVAAAEDKPLAGRKVLVTAGGTVERIDPVRFLTNDSSGKMGFAVAQAAQRMGADVTVVAARFEGRAPEGVRLVRVQSALDMLGAVLSEFETSDIVVKAAAVADYRPARVAEQKIKKSGDTLTIELVRNPDILQTLGERKKRQVLDGFAAETEKLDEHAQEKLRRKNCDLLVANDVSKPGSGFGTDTNEVRIFDRTGLVAALPLLHKQEVAERLLRLAIERLPEREDG